MQTVSSRILEMCIFPLCALMANILFNDSHFCNRKMLPFVFTFQRHAIMRPRALQRCLGTLCLKRELQHLEQDCNLKQVLCFTVMQNNSKI